MDENSNLKRIADALEALVAMQRSREQAHLRLLYRKAGCEQCRYQADNGLIPGNLITGQHSTWPYYTCPSCRLQWYAER